MASSAIHAVKVAIAASLLVLSVATAMAQYNPYRPYRPAYSPPSSSGGCYSAGNSARCPSIYRPDVPLEQQQYYDRNAVGQNVG